MGMTKEEKKEYMKKYREANKEKMKEYNRKYREAHREYYKEYRQTNKEKLSEQTRKYRQTPIGKKNYTISNWKERGLIHSDYEELYDRYLKATHCEECNVEFGEFRTGTYKCMDHCHITGEFRNFLCNTCNLNRK